VTYFNYTSGQFSGLHAVVIAGTLRDSLPRPWNGHRPRKGNDEGSRRRNDERDQ
jgi:hypothetical protein